MNYYVKHSLPGRIRIRYDKNTTTPRQATLAQSLLSVQEGMTKVTLNYTTGSFLIYYDEDILSEKNIKAFFMALTDKYLNDEEMLNSVEIPQKQDNILNILALMTVNHYIKQLLPTPLRVFFRIVSLAPRILKGIESISHGKLFKAEVLDATAISLSILTGDYKTASNINFLLNIGETIEEYTKKKSYSDLALTMLSDKDMVQIVEGNTEKSVPLFTLKKDDVVVVRTGSLIPADGEVIGGEGLVNQASITGEPLAVEKRKGTSVFAGTVVQEGELFICVRAIGSQTKVQNILSMIENSQQLKVSSQIRSEYLADKLVKYNFILSLITFLFTRNITKVMSTLMVDYSCAMKLAAPIAVLSAMKESAKHGILVKGGKFLEDVSLADTVVLDKTGTITEAKPKLARVISFSDKTENDLLTIAACLEEHFAHPVAAAIVHAAKERNLQHPEEHAKVEYLVAHGIATSLYGKKLLIGSYHFIFEDEKVLVPDSLNKIIDEAIANGESLLYLAEENKLIGIFTINDPVRKDAKSIISKLHRSGIKNCTMITGDDEGAASTAAKATNVDYYISHALPEDKVNYINEQKKNGHKVIMIGDGINDAPALATADTGIAMGDCAAITGETADIVLSSNDGLEGLYKMRIMGKRLMKKIESNNRGIIAVNSSLILLGLAGLINPSLAAILHNSSTVLFSIKAAQPLLTETTNAN